MRMRNAVVTRTSPNMATKYVRRIKQFNTAYGEHPPNSVRFTQKVIFKQGEDSVEISLDFI
jgi:hypothetical protein